MRLGRRVKFNMMIAILLCMAFVVNIGATWASIDYAFYASSINSSTKVDETTTLNHDDFVDFASADSATGTYEYKPGVSNNQLSINYGFGAEYDLMVRFKATYANKGALMSGDETHIANDFSLNFANRDNWCVDMGTAEDITADEPDNTYYTTTSTDNSQILKGVMYYMDTLSGSGTLPVISGVTFYASVNDSYKYIGDILTVELEPVFVKTSQYGTAHKFYSTTADANGFIANETAFTNWSNYMSQKGETTYATTSTFMIYNTYAGGTKALAYPRDASVINADGTVNTSLVTQPTYANTAYRYQINTITNGESVTTTRTYNAITAGNRYYGGLGVYVIPSSNLKTISITVPYFWQNAGTTTSNVVTFEYSSDITTLTINGDARHYYREEITKPTYINVFDYIMLTAEKSYDYIKDNYTLILNNIDVKLIYDSDVIPTDDDEKTTWVSKSRPNFEIHNSTSTSPILARVKDVYTGTKFYDANISITNKSDKQIAIDTIKITSLLWYGEYVSPAEGQASKFKQTAMGDGYLPSDGILYDNNVWSVKDYTNGVFTLQRTSGYNYIPSGYTVNVVEGIKISNISACQSGGVANDFWCSLLVDIDEVTTTTPTYVSTSTSGVEIITKGYYNKITSDNPGKIYIRNNTSQVITAVSLTNLAVNELNGTEGFLPRDDISISAATYTLTENLTGTVSIKPNETILAYEIESSDAIISSFDLSVTLSNGEESKDIDLIYNDYSENGYLYNHSDKAYEFRLKSATDITSKLQTSSSFYAKVVDGTYYYYYKGIICSGLKIHLLKDLVTNVEVEYIEKTSTTDESKYIATNYNAWGLDDVADKEWFDAMKKLYQAPTEQERETAIVAN